MPVSFSANAGQLSASSAVTDDTGTARVALTTSRETIVTANVAGKTAELTIALNPRTGITLTGPTNPVSAGLPASFTVGVGGTANVRDVTVDFGDGARQSLGAISARRPCSTPTPALIPISSRQRDRSQRLHRTGLDVGNDPPGPAPA